LVRIPRADLRPHERLGFDGYELLGGVHVSIFPGCGGMSSFRLTAQQALPRGGVATVVRDHSAIVLHRGNPTDATPAV
jgi:hypothetical protein